MKKFLTLALTTALILTATACGNSANDPSGDPLKRDGGTESTQGSTDVPGTSGENIGNTDIGGNSGDIDLGEIPDGGAEGAGTIYSQMDPAAKQAMIDAAKEDGAEVKFNADGSTTIIDADGTSVTQNADGTFTYKSDDGEEGQYGGDWPDNEFTKLVPKPDFDLVAASTTEDECTVAFVSVSIEQLREYAESAKAKGFDKDAEIQDEEMMGMYIYSYTASNDSGYIINIFSAAGASGMTISKNQ